MKRIARRPGGGLAPMLLLLAACGGAPPAPQEPGGYGSPAAEDPVAPAPDPQPTAEPPSSRTGLAFENPIKTCGPQESYAHVASYRCDDGSMPLGGDPARGQRARLGSSDSHLPDRDPADFTSSHIVDIYEVPCATGAVTLYVCMYHCPDGRPPY